MIAFQLVTGEASFYVVGVYIPPSDLGTLDDVRLAWSQCPTGCKALLLGDLKINLELPHDERDETIVEEMDKCPLSCMGCHYQQHRHRLMQGRWTRRQQCLDRWVSSKPDFIMAREGYGHRFRNVAVRAPCHHDSDHRVMIASLRTRGKKSWPSTDADAVDSQFDFQSLAPEQRWKHPSKSFEPQSKHLRHMRKERTIGSLPQHGRW